MMQLNALQLGQTCKANLTISLWLVVMGQAWEFFFFFFGPATAKCPPKNTVVEKNKYSRLRFSLGDDPLINKGYNNTTPNTLIIVAEQNYGKVTNQF